MPSRGRLAVASTGVMARMLPPGMPGTAKEASTTANTTRASCGTVNVTSKRRARKSTPAVWAMAAPK